MNYIIVPRYITLSQTKKHLYFLKWKGIAASHKCWSENWHLEKFRCRQKHFNYRYNDNVSYIHTHINLLSETFGFNSIAYINFVLPRRSRISPDTCAFHWKFEKSSLIFLLIYDINGLKTCHLKKLKGIRKVYSFNYSKMKILKQNQTSYFNYKFNKKIKI